jgi:hypothetical protein
MKRKEKSKVAPLLTHSHVASFDSIFLVSSANLFSKIVRTVLRSIQVIDWKNNLVDIGQSLVRQPSQQPLGRL